MPLPELLCPAGDEAALRAAVDGGADAVYLGYKAFGARASAVNFDEDALQRAVSYAHLYGARVHVTVNTLTKQEELAPLRDALCVIAEVGADAVIVQDLGVAALVRDHFPTLSLHASTQMAICNATGARFAQGFGFERVVLARECAREDVEAVVQTGVETEIFVHGALCSAVSGRCLMSSMAGGRSGNRGRCAQPCRQCLRMDAQTGALLSLRDLCLLYDLPALCDMGVSSLKIEGRLKSAEYVDVVTRVYRRALDDIKKGNFDPSDPRPREALMQIFNRGGFTRGHVMGDEDASLCATDRVGHAGVPLGTVIAVRHGLCDAQVERDLHDGDSLQIRSREDVDLRYSGRDVPAGGTAILRLRPDVVVRAGDPIARLCDAHQLARARDHQPKPLPVTMQAVLEAGAPMQLTLRQGAHSVTVTGECVQAAKNRAATVEDVRRSLAKLGDSPFSLLNDSDLSITLSDGCFLPVSALNALRREGCDALEASVLKAALPKPRTQKPHAVHTAPPALFSVDSRCVLTSDVEALAPLREAGATHLFYAPRTFTVDALSHDLPRLPEGTWLSLPPQMSEGTLQAILPLLKGVYGLVAQSVGQLDLPFDGPILAGEGVPICNREALRALTQTRACGFTLWTEWSQGEQAAFAPYPLPALLKVYGRETLMLLNHCPERVKRGLSSNRTACQLCTTPTMACGREDAALIDRKGYHFPLRRTVFAEGCELRVLGALPTDLRAFDDERRALNAGRLLVFTTESVPEQVAITQAFFQNADATPAQSTSGHWHRGVE